MEVLLERCAGLDVHKKTVEVCFHKPDGKEHRQYLTMTADLIEMRDWLVANGCTHVAMESTGPYWKPLYNLLEETGMELVVVNPRDVKAVPVARPT